MKLSIFKYMFKIPDLRKRIVFTLLMFGVYRLGAAVPVPGVDLEAVQRLTESGTQAGIYGLLNLFSGGALETFSVFALGIMPYITASIILQLLTVVIPRLQKLQETDYVVLSDVVISEDRLTVIKNYRQELRDFINKIMTGEIVVDWWKNDNDFVELYFPKIQT